MNSKPRHWILPLTYEPKIVPVRAGTCRQTIRALLPHKCNPKTCKGPACRRCHGTGIIQPTPKKVGDLISFHGWSGTPYDSPWSWRTPYWEITYAQKITILSDSIILELSENHTIQWWWNYWEVSELAKLDGIVPPTGEALRDVLISKNGPIPAEGIKAQIIRWQVDECH